MRVLAQRLAAERERPLRECRGTAPFALVPERDRLGARRPAAPHGGRPGSSAARPGPRVPARPPAPAAVHRSHQPEPCALERVGREDLAPGRASIGARRHLERPGPGGRRVRRRRPARRRRGRARARPAGSGTRSAPPRRPGPRGRASDGRPSRSPISSEASAVPPADRNSSDRSPSSRAARAPRGRGRSRGPGSPSSGRTHGRRRASGPRPRAPAFAAERLHARGEAPDLLDPPSGARADVDVRRPREVGHRDDHGHGAAPIAQRVEQLERPMEARQARVVVVHDRQGDEHLFRLPPAAT